MNKVDTALEKQISPDSAPPPSLDTTAEIAWSWDVVHRPFKSCLFFARVRTARRALKKLEADLLRKQAAAIEGAKSNARYAALLELGTSYRLMRSAISALTDERRRVSRLPRIVHKAGAEEPRMAAIANTYLNAVSGIFSTDSFCHFLHAIQSREALNVDELWCAGAFLKFALLELLLENANALLATEDTAPTSALLSQLHSLRLVTNIDWGFLVQPLITFDGILSQDPAAKYTQMDFESHQLYRRRVAFIARFSDCTESRIAQLALELAR